MATVKRGKPGTRHVHMDLDPSEWGVFTPHFLQQRKTLSNWCESSSRRFSLYEPEALSKRSPYKIVDLVPRLILLEAPRRHHALMNYYDLREVCKKARIPYYREMSTSVQRSVLYIWAATENVPGDLLDL